MQVVCGAGVKNREGIKFVADERIDLERFAELVVLANEADEELLVELVDPDYPGNIPVEEQLVGLHTL